MITRTRRLTSSSGLLGSNTEAIGLRADLALTGRLEGGGPSNCCSTPKAMMKPRAVHHAPHNFES